MKIILLFRGNQVKIQSLSKAQLVYQMYQITGSQPFYR